MKEAVLPFNRFPDVDTVLGPEMRSTGEVMGIDRTFGLAFGKSQIAAGDRLPDDGMRVPVAGRPRQGGRPAGPPRSSSTSGSPSPPPHGTADHLERHGVPVAQRVAKVTADGDRPSPAGERMTRGRGSAGLPTAVDLISAGKVAPRRQQPPGSRGPGRRGLHPRGPPTCTASRASPRRRPATAAAESTVDRSQHHLRVRTLQEYHAAGGTTVDGAAGGGR